MDRALVSQKCHTGLSISRLNHLAQHLQVKTFLWFSNIFGLAFIKAVHIVVCSQLFTTVVLGGLAAISRYHN